MYSVSNQSLKCVSLILCVVYIRTRVQGASTSTRRCTVNPNIDNRRNSIIYDPNVELGVVLFRETILGV